MCLDYRFFHQRPLLEEHLADWVINEEDGTQLTNKNKWINPCDNIFYFGGKDIFHKSRVMYKKLYRLQEHTHL